MRDRGAGRAWVVAVSVAVALGVALAGGSRAQNPPAKGKAGKAARGKAKGEPLKKAAVNAADPLDNAGGDPLEKAATGMFHYRVKLKAVDGVTLAVTYFPAYPARLGTTAPVILMIHEKDRSGKDFEDPIADLKGQGLAEHMQGLGYVVLTMDLRGQGANVRKPLTPQDWRLMIDDMQAAYQFLVDRHNRGKLNLAKFGVLALGEGANLAAAWANMPGGAVSSEGRTSDLGAMVLVSPHSDGEGFLLSQVMASLGPRIPLMLAVGGRDVVSGDPVRAVRPIVERTRLNRVELFDTSLHGYKLLRLEPGVTAKIAKFFEGTIKFKVGEWEPRYNLTPVEFGDIQLVRTVKGKDEAKKKDEAKPKAKDDAAARKRAPE